MRALLDINVLIAVLDADHSLHERAREWLGGHGQDGWTSCPITPNGCVRIMSHPAYPNALPVRQVMERLREATELPTTSSGPTTSACWSRASPTPLAFTGTPADRSLPRRAGRPPGRAVRDLRRGGAAERHQRGRAEHLLVL
jgi:hypothetical protein